MHNLSYQEFSEIIVEERESLLTMSFEEGEGEDQNNYINPEYEHAESAMK
jgi:hypothetical protein